MKIKYIIITLAIVFLSFGNAQATSNPGSGGMTFNKGTYQVYETGSLFVNMGAIGGTAICPNDAVYTITIPRSMRLNETTAELQQSLNTQTGGLVFSVISNMIDGTGVTTIILGTPNGIPGSTNWDIILPVIGFMQSGLLQALLSIEPNASCAGGNLQSGDDNQSSPVIVSGFLPVTLTSFNATVINCKTQLNWKTSAEDNLKNYELEMSTDGINYDLLTTVDAKGVNGKGSNYSYSYTAKNGTTYYRLKSVDLNSSYAFSNVAKVTKDCGKVSVNVYPNPASELISIDINNFADNDKMIGVLYNLSGAEVSRYYLNNANTQIRVSDFTSGVYYLKVSGKELNETIEVVIK